MRHHPFAQRLACRLVKTCFGDICEAVAKCLMDRGPQTLREVVHLTEFKHLKDADLREKRRESERLVKAALQSLIQHGCIVCYLVQPEVTRRNLSPEEFHMYTIDLPAIVNIIRLPFYIQHIWQWYSRPGDESSSQIHQAIVQSLLENGRLVLEQIVSAVKQKEDVPEEGADAAIKNAFQALVLDRYIEHAMPCNLPAKPTPVFAKLTGRKAAAPKPGSDAQKKAEELLAKQLPAQQYLDNRYKITPDLTSPQSGVKREAEDLAGGEEPAKSSKKQKTSKVQKVSRPSMKKASAKNTGASVKASPAVKAEPAAVQAVGPAAGIVDDAPQLWQISHSTFKRRFRHNACADVIHFKSGVMSGTLARAMLRACKASMNVEPQDERFSAAVTEADVQQVLNQMADLPEDFQAPEDLSEALDTLAEGNPGLVLKSTVRGHPAYYLDLTKIIASSKIKELQGVIKRRFGVHGVRVWNCLHQFKQMESKTIHERALIPHNDTRELLYKLLRAGFIALQDIPRTADHAPSKTFYLWKVDLEAAYAHLTVNMLKAVCNLQDRLHSELKTRHRLMYAIEKGDKAALQSFAKEVQQLRGIVTQLDCHMLSLTPTIALFIDF